MSGMGRGVARRVLFALAAHINAQPLDLLIQGGKRDLEALGRLRLIPIGALEHVQDDAPLALFYDVKERRVGFLADKGKESSRRSAIGGEKIGEQLGAHFAGG